MSKCVQQRMFEDELIKKSNDVYSFILEHIRRINARTIKILSDQIICEHKWEEFGHGYKCAKCNFYSGDDSELNYAIEKVI